MSSTAATWASGAACNSRRCSRSAAGYSSSSSSTVILLVVNCWLLIAGCWLAIVQRVTALQLATNNSPPAGADTR
ncbi:hypothetical protein E5K00_00330 [Hymenobacter aquaticus]|uniref:Uncharacterized protein n=1 Tax=Hymenobacter aquaticus TaxID=1867101 RepID=A0A4Z0Q3H1_9BACT|nr:hypothetical protein E5K00_00330 [Hymenobacter aquaticus]